ncbi:MAG: MBL fold metallo-hydrolase [Candidatus Bipolaricaulia bacterium]
MLVLIERLVVGELETNCYILKGGGEATVIDPGAEDERLLRAIEGQRLRYILLTHAHPDHLGGVPQLKRDFKEAALLLHRADLEGFRLFLPHLEPDGLLEEGAKLEFGNESLQVLHTPGHSPGSLVFMIDRGLFVGDLIFWGSIGRTDLPGGSQAEMARSLRRIIGLDGDFRLYPGHGPETTLARERAQNPFLKGL